MDDKNTEYNIAEAENDPIGPAILYPIIASVFSAFFIISIAAFALSNRKCCKRRAKDPESTLLKQRLISEQKQRSKYKFNFLFKERPIFSSIMQQEENDIAEEVQESYKTISKSISKPIICCPNKKNGSYIYNPKTPIKAIEIDLSNIAIINEKFDVQKVQNTDDKQNAEIAEQTLKDFDNDSLNGKILDNRDTLHNEFIDNVVQNPSPFDLIDSLEKKIVPLKDETKKEITKKFFTESEIENAVNLKSLYFDKWIRNTNECEKYSEMESYQHQYSELDLSRDDVESILTSISRMDSCRMKKLQESKFYKNLVFNMETIDAGNTPCITDDIDANTLNKIIESRTGQNSFHNLSHEELMQVISPSITGSIKESGNVSYLSSVEDESIPVNLKYYHGEKKTERNPNKTKNVKQVPTKEYSSESTTVAEESLFESTLNRLSDDMLDGSYSDSLADRDSIKSENSSPKLRPRSLDLKKRNTELMIDVMSSESNSRSSANTSAKYFSRTVYSNSTSNNDTTNTSLNSSSSSSWSSKASSITTWQGISEASKNVTKHTRKRLPPDSIERSNRDRQETSSTSSNEHRASLSRSFDLTTIASNVHSSRHRNSKKYKSYSVNRDTKQKRIDSERPSNSFDSSYSSCINSYSSVDTLSKEPKKLIPSQSLPKFVTGNPRTNQSISMLPKTKKNRKLS